MISQVTPIPPSDNRKSTFTENFRDFLMNSQTLFSISKTQPPKISHQHDVIYILGENFSLEHVKDPKILNKAIEQALEKIIWFSYRKNFPILKPKTDKTSYVSDTGWGCSIRVGQMLFAEVLKRHLKMKDKPEKIISFFADCEADPVVSPFGIQQITIASAVLFNLNPGDWFKFTHVLLIFENLYHNFANETIPELEFMMFSDGIIFINQIYEKVSSYSECMDCRKSKFELSFREKLCEKCRKFNKSLFLTICLMPTPSHLRTQDFDFISELLSSRFSVGMMGGKPKRAKYFVSAKDQLFLCKDPHYVQEPTSDFLDCSSYFSKEIKYVEVGKMSSSLAFGFYLRNEEEFEEFEEFLRKGKEKLGEKWLMGFEEEFYQEVEFNNLMKEEEEEKCEEVEEVEENSLVILEKKASVRSLEKNDMKNK